MLPVTPQSPPKLSGLHGYSLGSPALQRPVSSSLGMGGARWPVQVSFHVITLYKHSTASLSEPHLCLLGLIRAKVFFTL